MRGERTFWEKVRAISPLPVIGMDAADHHPGSDADGDDQQCHEHDMGYLSRYTLPTRLVG
jgi:hypothetical protein